jgi:quercetin dioxygenase-like cupin family protein
MEEQNGYILVRGKGIVESSKIKETLHKLLGNKEFVPTTFSKEPGYIVDPHYHTENLAAYVLKGKVRLQTGKDLSDIIECSPGDAFMMKKGTIHREEVISNVRCEMTGVMSMNIKQSRLR